MIPFYLHALILSIHRRWKAHWLRNEILAYGRNHASDLDAAQLEAINWLKTHGLAVFPYYFAKKYQHRNVKVYTEAKSGLKYVLHGGKRLYYKRSHRTRTIQLTYNAICMEQDPDCAHCYSDERVFCQANDIVVDAGAAEGNFGLSCIDTCRKLYLFEPDAEWLEPLAATFAPWREKVVIINKSLSDFSTSTKVALDEYFVSGDRPTYLKVDIEGAELKLLQGGKRMLSGRGKMKVSMCAYHSRDDELVLASTLRNYGFAVWFSKGYMLFYESVLEPPYFRRGIIRAEKVE